MPLNRIVHNDDAQHPAAGMALIPLSRLLARSTRPLWTGRKDSTSASFGHTRNTLQSERKLCNEGHHGMEGRKAGRNTRIVNTPP